ncbi:unnamed protein product [Anisakis simplex]|uniref:Uncharacterized protein n=1 Tax=Anisakis simplex TaxID=6269 RepID=A0A0M3IZE8_ANISI|nr:unnamed protein product [Anisakis simplex]
MRLTRLVKMLVRGPTGEMIWKEMRDLRLPSRGKKLSFKQNSLIAFAVFLSGFVYLQFQADFNPDSYWGSMFILFFVADKFPV